MQENLEDTEYKKLKSKKLTDYRLTSYTAYTHDK